jgi:hypothetical protein
MSLAEFNQHHEKMLGHFGHDWAHHLEMEDNLISLWQQSVDCALDNDYALNEKEGT